MSLFRRAGAAIARIFESAADPAAEPERVLVYGKDAAGATQLYARSSDGTVHQLTPAGGTFEPWQFNAGPPAFFSGFQRPINMTRLFDDLLTFAAIRTSTNGGGTAQLTSSGDGTGTVGLGRLQTIVNNDLAAISPCGTSGLLGTAVSGYVFEEHDTIGFDSRVRISAAAQSALNDYRMIIGLDSDIQSSLFSGSLGRGLAFIASFTDFGDNNWHAVTDGGVQAAANTGVAVDNAGGYHRFTITWDRATETANFYIDGLLTNTVNVVGASGDFGPMIGVADIVTTGGTRTMLADWFDVAAVVNR